ncbi:MAG: hypothetical protein EOO87_08600 [Pedobacter sp.]|nr:MAG: hypothetical protein EOO87_08600 [Pedobacter sp.]
MLFNKSSILILLFIISSLSWTRFGYAQTKSIKRIDSLYEIAKRIVNVEQSNKLNEQIIKESRAINYTIGEIHAEILLATNSYNEGKYSVALDRIQRIEPLVLSTENYPKIANLLALKANCYGRLKFFNKSYQLLNEAKAYAEKIEDKDRRYSNLGRIYRLIGSNISEDNTKPVNKDSVFYYHRRSYAVQDKIGAKTLKNGILLQANILGDIFFERNNIDSAKYYYNKALYFAKELKQSKFIPESKLGLATIQIKENDFTGALESYETALALSTKTKNLGNLKKSYYGLALVHEKLGNEEKSLDYSKKYGLMADSLTNSTVSAVSSSADLIIKENEKAFAQKSIRFFWIIAAIIAMLLLLIFSVIKLRKKNHQVILIKEEEQKALNERIQLLQADVLDEKDLAEVIRLAKNNDPAFFNSFKKTHPLFIQKLMLKEPGLLGSDLILCAQLRLGFYTKDIARYTKTTVRAVEGKKYRLRKKLNISTDEDIYSWILNL